MYGENSTKFNYNKRPVVIIHTDDRRGVKRLAASVCDSVCLSVCVCVCKTKKAATKITKLGT